MKIALYNMNMFQDDYVIKDILFEITEANIYDIIKFKDKFYVVNMVSRIHGFAGVLEITYNHNGEEQIFESLLKCPYCGHENQNSWDIGDSTGELECGVCGSEYTFEREISVTYSTYPKKANNIINQVSGEQEG